MFILFSLLITALYMYLMIRYVHNEWYFVIIWVITGIIIFYILTVLFIVFIIKIIFPRLKRDSKIKYFSFRIMAWWVSVFILNMHVKVIGKENMPKDGKLTIYANHKSKLDPVYMSYAVTRPHGYAAKSELGVAPVVSTLLNSIYSFYVYRQDNRETLRELLRGIELAKEGHVYAIFPEGGTMYRDHEDIRDVRAGAYKLAQKAETDIMPVTMLGTNKWAKRIFYFRPIRVKIIFHPVIKYEDYKDLSTNEIAEKVTRIINSAIK